MLPSSHSDTPRVVCPTHPAWCFPLIRSEHDHRARRGARKAKQFDRVMNEPSDLIKAIALRTSALEHANESQRNGYATPPIVAYGDEAGPEGELHLRDYWRTIRKRLWLIIGLAIIVGTITALKQSRQPDIYQARARVQVDVESSNPALGASKGYYSENTYMDPEYFNTQVQILSSPTLLRRVARNLDLEHNRTFLDPRIENIRRGRISCGWSGSHRKQRPLFGHKARPYLIAIASP